MKTINVDTAKTSELLAFYNAHSDKPVSKFTNLETARRRVTALIESISISQQAHDAAEAAKAAAKQAKQTAKDTTALAKAVDSTLPAVAPKAAAPAKKQAAKPVKASDAVTKTDPAKTLAEAVVATRRSNSAGIAASWNDAEVREARLYRQGVVVVVNGKAQDFNSTKSAFEALGLPVSKHIRFRMKLKEANKLTFKHAGKDYEFSIL